MSRLRLVKLHAAIDDRSPEAEYALGCLRVEAEQVWTEVELRRVAPDDARPLAGNDDDDDTLIVDRGSVLLCRRSLRAMAELLRQGAMAVVPRALASELRQGEAAPYTWRGFERFEARALAAGEPPADGAEPGRLLPVALVRGGVTPSLSAAALSDGAAPAFPVARAGLCHHFVDYYGQVREDVLPFLPHGAVDVLEIGCATGATGAFLQQRLGCRVTGIELNPLAAAAAAERLHAVHCGDVTEIALDERFDAIVALELFEHLPRGEEVLLRLASYLRPGGRIVLSVPNVGHHSVVLDLLAGRWDYLPIGLLCYTHFRFFTRPTLESWLRRLGLPRFTLVPQRTELAPEVEALAAVDSLALDRESLATKGFYVLIEP